MTVTPSPSDHEFSEDQVAELEACAIPADQAADLGIRALIHLNDLPAYAQKYGPTILPAMGFDWVSISGRTVTQVKPAAPIQASDHEKKYIWPKGESPIVHMAKNPADPTSVLVVEGTKQSRAAALYASPSTRVLGLGGCWNWMEDGVASPDWDELVEDLPVTVVFDADRKSNPSVWDAGARLKEALEALGAKSVTFADIPANGSATIGLDDYLGKREVDRRGPTLARLVKSAKRLAKNERPKATRSAPGSSTDPRPQIDVGDDPGVVTHTLEKLLKADGDGTEVFNYGDNLAQIEDQRTVPLTPELLDLRITKVCRPYKISGKNVNYTLPDTRIRGMIAGRSKSWTNLRAVSHTPFVRDDGSVCTAPGYDVESEILVFLPPDLVGLEVPHSPSPTQTTAAVDLLLGDMLGDFPFEDDASRANCLGLFLTPFIRANVPLVPLALINGLQMGVGKNKIANCLSILVDGKSAAPMAWVDDENESRKQLTSAFRGGARLFTFDEAHKIHGTSIAQALTATYWNDRILGVSQMANFPNVITWLALGNQIQIEGDIRRRVYPINLFPTAPNPELRSSSSFRHPLLEPWVTENRGPLLQALLTLVRSWYSAGQPFDDPFFGSFEAWQRMVGGILTNAGVKGFLTNLAEFKSESDHDTVQWERHLLWLRATYGTDRFRASDVAKKLGIETSDEHFPPRLERDGGNVSARKMGQLYGYQKNKSIGGLFLRTHRTTDATYWWVSTPEAPTPAPPTPAPPSDPTPTPPSDPAPTPEPATNQDSDTPLTDYVYDLETSGLDLWAKDPSFIRLVGTPDAIGTHAQPVLDAAAEGHRLVGHNILGFDNQVLASHHGLDQLTLSENDQVWDTQIAEYIADPPVKDDHKSYALDPIAVRRGYDGKVGDLKALAEEFGGFGKIPQDEPRYIEYAKGDIAATTKVFEAQTRDLTASNQMDYARREMRLMGRLTSSISYTGFRVDVPLLRQRLAEGAAVTARRIDELHTKYGMPLVDAKGVPFKSPQASKGGKEAIFKAFTDMGLPPEKWELLGAETQTDKGSPSTGKDSMACIRAKALSIGDPNVVELCDAILELNGVRSIYGTIDKHLVGDRVHPQVFPSQASGRFSVINPGLTVMGKRGGKHTERYVYLPEPGEVMVACDLNQVDQRAVAALSQDHAYAELFSPGRDSHTEVAMAVWGTADRREDAKTMGHAWNYGASVNRLSQLDGVTREMALEFDRSMRERFPRLVEWRDEARALAQNGYLLDNGWGRMMRPDPKRSWTQGPALLGQGCARDIMAEGVLRLPLHIVPMLRGIVHDEILTSIPEDQVDDVVPQILAALSFDFRGIQILAEASNPGTSWGNCYDH